MVTPHLWVAPQLALRRWHSVHDHILCHVTDFSRATVAVKRRPSVVRLLRDNPEIRGRMRGLENLEDRVRKVHVRQRAAHVRANPTWANPVLPLTALRSIVLFPSRLTGFRYNPCTCSHRGEHPESVAREVARMRDRLG